jgi:hypothetical protein
MYLLAVNINGSPSSLTTGKCAFASVGGGYTANESRALVNIVEKYNDALGRGAL